MTNYKFNGTPGPWLGNKPINGPARYNGYIYSEHTNVVIADMSNSNGPVETNANRNLIAEAPALLYIIMMAYGYKEKTISDMELFELAQDLLTRLEAAGAITQIK